MVMVALAAGMSPAVAGGADKAVATGTPNKKAPFSVAVLEVTDPVVIDSATKDFVPIVKAAPSAKKDTIMAVQATVNVRNEGDGPATVTYRAVLDGDHVHPTTYSVTVAPGSWDLSTAGFDCNLRAGQHTLEVQAQVSQASGSVVFAARSLFVVQGPITDLRG